MIPAIVGSALGLRERLGKRGRYRDTRLGLELLKLKYEIEAIRKSQQLNFPEITVAEEELELIRSARPEEVEVGWFDPKRLRKTFWYRQVQKRPQWGALVASLVSKFIGFYGAMIIVSAATVPLVFSNEEFTTAFKVFMVLAYLVIGLVLFLFGVRWHKARKLALEERRLSG